MRKIFIAIAASLLIALSSAVSLKQVHSKVLQNAQAHQPKDSMHLNPHPYKQDVEERAQLRLKQEDEEAEDEEEDDDEEEDPQDDDEEEPHELAQRGMRGYERMLGN